MDYIVPIIEQLARAARELRSRHLVYHRLGYILVDNAAELIVHQYARHQASSQRLWMRDPQLSPRQIRAARRGKFEDKLGVIVSLGQISEQERRFGSICHEYRNQVYHAGLRHEEVIQAVGGAYYRWCCDIFGRLPPLFYSIGGHQRPTPTAQALLDRIRLEHRIEFVPPVEKIVPYLLRMGPKTPDLAATLTRIADESIEAVKESMEFIQTDAPRRMSVAEVVHDSQQEAEIDRRLQSEDLDGDIIWTDTPRWERRNEIVRDVRENFIPRYHQVPFSSWRRRSATIREQPTEILTLDRYQDLRDAMAPLEGAIHDLASKLESWIQNEIDIARGK